MEDDLVLLTRQGVKEIHRSSASLYLIGEAFLDQSDGVQPFLDGEHFLGSGEGDVPFSAPGELDR
jgi:hypothetical protein